MFGLIDPKRYDALWKDTEAQGLDCHATAEAEDPYRMAATTRTKLPVVKARVIERRRGAGQRRPS